MSIIAGLSNAEEAMICAVLQSYPQVQEARVFGSRALGRAQPYSDIDLALWGDISTPVLAAIAGELEELPLPYRFDVLAVESLHHLPLREHIERVGKSFYRHAPALTV